MKVNFFLGGILLLGLCYLPVKAQIVITNISQTYEQDFDSFGTNDIVWTDNSTLTGWYAEEIGNAVNVLTASDGTVVTVTNKIFNFGTILEFDRALGSIENNNEAAFYGARFTNNSFSTITNLTIKYTGEQWMGADFAFPQSLQFFYRVGGIDFLADTNNVGWVPVIDLNFTNLQTFLFTPLNGNAGPNRTGLQANIPLVVSNNQEFWIKWFHQTPAASHGLAVDDLEVSFNGVPEAVALNFDVELKRPKQTRTLKFKSGKGFKVSGRIKGTNTVSKVSYVAFGGTNFPTNLTFIEPKKLKILKKGKLFKKGFIVLFKGKSNKTGKDIVPDTTLINLVIKVDGASLSNQIGSFETNFVFIDAKVK